MSPTVASAGSEHGGRQAAWGPAKIHRRSGRRVALLARYPERDRAMPQFIPNLGLYMVEAALRASRLAGLEIKTVLSQKGNHKDALRSAVIG